MIQDIKLTRYYYADQREQFSLTEDTYQGWVMLAAQDGSFSFTIDGGDDTKQQLAQFGELIFCPPNHILKRHVLQKLSFHFCEFTCLGDWTLPQIVRLKDISRLRSTFQYLQEWQESEDLHQQFTSDARHLIKDLIFQSHREQYKTQHHSAGTIDPLMNRAAAYIETRTCEHELSLQELATTLGISNSQLTRRFQAAYGLSPVRFSTKVRLTRARLLLVETQDSLENIAEQCGFQNAFYFSRVFSQHMGISPSGYRKNYRV
ncbi:helix-turn-helix domain-containing protein [Paenibacillus qinlingensis]|uniref:AraC-like DNA-binding protein n=1 Tax=Paenibacillus qinlingensis TaxID=1837343 RepID=A0ABU1P0R6_9BACL|nr:helix-turn-helix domain-containing protein [Paenibacillus qinlingensis]MDR6553144.1 AraC-like DNA-binding protein [Paenibacillus qinlingensis]